MKLHVLPDFLLRAPLLPLRALPRAGAALRAHPLGEAAIALASPDLAAAAARARPTADATRALDRYGRRAAFRPTPSGLLAGVAAGALGARTAIATGVAAPHLRPSWAALAGVARALIAEPEVRPHVALRAAPSLVIRAGVATWLAFGDAEGDDGALAVEQAELDEVLGAILSITEEWRPWAEVHALLAGLDGDDGVRLDDASLDDYLLVLLDRGLLHDDLTPPLVGPPPLEALRARLERLPRAAVGAAARALEALDEVEGRCAPAPASPRGGARPEAPAKGRGRPRPPAVDVAGARAALAALTAAPRGSDLHGVLRFGPPTPPQLARAAVERAAAAAPFLFSLQQALAAPIAERALDEGLLEALAGLAEIFGAGAFDVGALVAGSYGAAFASTAEPPPPPGGAASAVARLAGLVVAAARAGEEEIALVPDEWTDLVLPVAPPSFELVLQPAREPPRAAPGTGWLLGLHAPAGASWGRFAEALGESGRQALAALAEAEARAGAGAAVDVVFAPSRALADLCTHPPARAAALALCGWPMGATALQPDALELVNDPGAAVPLGLRAHGHGVIEPRPLHRVRSTTAPPGIYRLLAGWSFARQHAPWALTWGPLAELPWLPRVSVGGFVVAPASFRVPPREALKRQGAVARWRREARVPALVQAGEGDELLPIDLAAPGAAGELERFAGGRVFEVWPPPARLVDRDGRRVEAVVAVLAQPEGDEARAGASAIEIAGAVPPPSEQPPAEGWTTWKLFGAEERQDTVLLEAVAPVVRGARGASEIDGWFFQRYVEGPGRRPHLRLRAHAASARGGEAFARRLERAIEALRDSEDVVAVERAGHFRESARYGGAEAAAQIEALFALSSELVLELLARDAEAEDEVEADRVELVVRASEALARGFGLAAAARRALADRRRAAYEAETGPEEQHARQGAFRRRSRRLQGLLGGSAQDIFSDLFAAHEAAVAAAVDALPPPARAGLEAALAPLLHVNAVRLVGADREAEASAFVFWARTLEGLAARARR